jgi:hypothetical protein
LAATSRTQLALRERLLDEIRRQPLEKVELPVDERQPCGLTFHDDGDFDATDERQLLSPECSRDRQCLGR